MSNEKIINQLLLFENLYQHTKKLTVLSICSGQKAILKILQSDWLRTFWLIYQEKDFSQIWDLCRNTANNRNFIIDKLRQKLISKFFFQFKKPYLWPIFPIFGAKRVFPKNVTHIFIRVFSTMPKFRKK